MLKSKTPIVAILGALVLMLAIALPMTTAMDVPIITKEELKERMETGEVVILDVRQGRDWDSSEFKIKGARSLFNPCQL